jgi:hypothetical protein
MSLCGIEALVVARDALDLDEQAAAVEQSAEVNWLADQRDPAIAGCLPGPIRTVRPANGRSSG